MRGETDNTSIGIRIGRLKLTSFETYGLALGKIASWIFRQIIFSLYFKGKQTG